MGAEAYTIAMVLATMQASGVEIRFSILGTDINNEIPRQAREAIYPISMLEPISADMQKRYSRRRCKCRRRCADWRHGRRNHGRTRFRRFPIAERRNLASIRSLQAYYKRTAQLAENIGAVDVTLTANESKALDAVSVLPKEYPGWMLELQGAYRSQATVRSKAGRQKNSRI